MPNYLSQGEVNKMKACKTKKYIILKEGSDMESRVLFNFNVSTSACSSDRAKLTTLLDWCKIVRCCIDSGQIEDAKIFLEQAIIEAHKPQTDIDIKKNYLLH